MCLAPRGESRLIYAKSGKLTFREGHVTQFGQYMRAERFWGNITFPNEKRGLREEWGCMFLSHCEHWPHDNMMVGAAETTLL